MQERSLAMELAIIHGFPDHAICTETRLITYLSASLLERFLAPSRTKVQQWEGGVLHYDQFILRYKAWPLH